MANVTTVRRILAGSLILGLGSCTNPGGGLLDQTPGAADPEEQNSQSSPGQYAPDYLSDATFSELLVEIDYVQGWTPSAAATDTLAATLGELCRKPDGVTILVDDEIPATGGGERSTADIEALELGHRDHYRDPDTGVAVLYCVYLDGHSDRDQGGLKVLGVAYRGSSCAMFLETIESVDPGLPLFAEIEDTVLLHEAGHLLGLVDNGTPMITDHRDPDHGAHDSSSDCIMHWMMETQNVVDVLINGKPDFGQECRADMIAAGGAPPSG